MIGRWLLNGFLLLVCVLLWQLAIKPVEPVPGLAQRVGLTPDQITRIMVQHGEYPPVVLEATASGWVMREPISGPVAESMRDRLLAIMRAPTRLVFSLEPATAEGLGGWNQDLTELGLDQPWLVLEMNGRRLSAGAAAPGDQRRYLRAGDDILLIDDRWLLPVLAPPEDYLDEAKLNPAGAVRTGQ